MTAGTMFVRSIGKGHELVGLRGPNDAPDLAEVRYRRLLAGLSAGARTIQLNGLALRAMQLWSFECGRADAEFGKRMAAKNPILKSMHERAEARHVERARVYQRLAIRCMRAVEDIVAAMEGR